MKEKDSLRHQKVSRHPSARDNALVLMRAIISPDIRRIPVLRLEQPQKVFSVRLQ
jgi:hypothetical protein